MTALLAWGQTEVALSLAIAWASEEKDVLAGRGLLSKLIECEAFSLAGDNALAGLLGEAKSADAEVLGEVEQPDIIGDGADNGNDLAFLITAVLGNAAEADGITVEAGLVESFVNHSVEGAISPAGQERVQLQ